jgi:hypothetical protein
MADSIPAGRSRILSSPAFVSLAAGVILYGVILFAGNRLLNDPDSYWHLVVGRWILEHRAFPTTDPFSFTMTGTHWIAKEWLSQILYAGAHALGSWSGMAILAAAAIALAFVLLMRFLTKELASLPAIGLAAMAFVIVAPHALARPHALALPVMVAFVGGLVRAVDRNRPPSWRLVPLMLLWANLHGGFTLGILLTGAVALDAIVETDAGRRMSVALRWMGFGVAVLIAACITPYGPESILVTFRILGLGPALSIIKEWRPQDFSHLAAFEVCLLLGIGLALRYRFRLPPVRILILLGLLHLALSAERNGEALGLLAPLFLARPLALQYPGLATGGAGEERGDRRAAALVAALAAGLTVATTAAIMATESFAPNPRVTPDAAVAALQRAGADRILNDYDFGGYLVFAGVAPFIDGRTELYGTNFVIRHHRANTLADLPGFLRLLDEYRIGGTLLSPHTPAVAFLDRLPGWQRIYADDVAVAHVRSDDR